MQSWKLVAMAALCLGQSVRAQSPGVTIIEVPRDRQSTPSKPAPAPAPASSSGYSGRSYGYAPVYTPSPRSSSSYCTCFSDTANRQTLVSVLTSTQFDKLAQKLVGQLADAKIESELTETGCKYSIEVTYADQDGEECSLAAHVYRKRNSSLLSPEYEITKNTCETPAESK